MKFIISPLLMNNDTLTSMSDASMSLDVARAKQRIQALKKKYALVMKARAIKDKLLKEREKMVKSHESIMAMKRGDEKKAAVAKWRQMRDTYRKARAKLHDFKEKNGVGSTSDNTIKGITERAQRWFDRIAKSKK